MALLGPLAGCPGRERAWTLLVAPVVCTPIHAARQMSAAPTVSARGGSQAFILAQRLESASGGGMVPVPGAYCTVVS